MREKMKKIVVANVIIALLVLTFGVNIQKTNASALIGLTDQMSSTKFANPTNLANHDIRYQQVGQLMTGTITVDFNTAGFVSGTVDYTDIDLFYGSDQAQVNGSCSSNCNNATIAADAGASIWGATISSNNLTLAYPTSVGPIVQANDYVRIKIGTNASGGDQQYNNPTTPSTTSQKIIAVVSGPDSGSLAVVIVTDDQVVVNASVAPTLSFSISDNAIGFGSISADTNVHWATANGVGQTSEPASDNPVKLIGSTNASSGLLIKIKSNGDGSSAAGLYSATTTQMIEAAASSVVAANTDGYGVYGKNAASLTIDEAYDNDFDTDVAITRSMSSFASTTGPVADGSVDLTLKAGVAGSTKAGAYTDTITIQCSGNF